MSPVPGCLQRADQVDRPGKVSPEVFIVEQIPAVRKTRGTIGMEITVQSREKRDAAEQKACHIRADHADKQGEKCPDAILPVQHKEADQDIDQKRHGIDIHEIIIGGKPQINHDRQQDKRMPAA